jgi:hypothetical protein
VCESATVCSLFVDIWLKLAQATILYWKFKNERVWYTTVAMVELDAVVKRDKLC